MQKLSGTNGCGLTRIKFDKGKESSSLSLSMTSCSLFELCGKWFIILRIYFVFAKLYMKSMSV